MGGRTRLVVAALAAIALIVGLAGRRYSGLNLRPPAETAAQAADIETATPAAPAAIAPTPSLIAIENSQPGTPNWQITNYAAAGEIQGYAGATSVTAGDSLALSVSTRVAGTPYRIDIFRMGWYGGAGARLMRTVPDLIGMAQGYYVGGSVPVACSRCLSNPSTGLLDANWLVSYSLTIPDSWVTGMYLARLTDAAGKQSYIPFVVQQDAPAAALLVKLSVNTYEAYNAWGGKSLYAYDSLGAKTAGGTPAAVKVSFNRPYASDYGSGQFLRYEYNLVRWLERAGYDVSYVTDSDVDSDRSTLFMHRGFISAGHDEYWTAQERANVAEARDRGLNLAFLSGDAVYWQARYEPSAGGAPDRTLVEYRNNSDPDFSRDPALATVRWQDAPVRRPENELTGTIYSSQAEPFTQDWVVKDASSWLFAGTGLKAGDHVAGLVGKEFDRSAGDVSDPPGLDVLAHSSITVPAVDRPPNVEAAESTVYVASSGAIVFSAGTVTWSWGLDGASYPMGTTLHNTPISPAIQRLTKNLLDQVLKSDPVIP